MGATAAVCVNKESLQATKERLGITDGFMIGLEMSGNFNGFNDLLQNLQPEKLACLAFASGGTIDWDIVIFKMITQKGIYGREVFRTWDKMLICCKAA